MNTSRSARATDRSQDVHGTTQDAEQPARLLTIDQIAAYLQVSAKTVRRLVASRRLPCIRLGRVLRFQQADVFRFIEARKE